MRPNNHDAAEDGAVRMQAATDAAFRTEFARRERCLRWPVAIWMGLLVGLGISGAGPFLFGLGIATPMIAALAIWVWRCPRCGKELEVRPDACKHCGLVLR